MTRKRRCHLLTPEVADASHLKGGRLGPFQVVRRYRHKEKDRDDLLGTDLGRLYSAHNVHTGAACLVVLRGQRVAWEPEESWQVRATAHSTPPYIALWVEHAPAADRLMTLVQLLDQLTCAVERMERSEEAGAHLTGEPVRPLRRWLDAGVGFRDPDAGSSSSRPSPCSTWA